MSSCTFFELPPRPARDVGIREKPKFDWLKSDKEHKQSFTELKDLIDLERGLCPGLANVVRRGGDDDDCPNWNKHYGAIQTEDPQTGTLVSEFLHVSDAQIRDESLYDSSPLDLVQLGVMDLFIDVTIRRALVERFDSLTLASFLLGYAKAHQKIPDQRNHFIIHTGDLLDISVVTELMEGMEIFKGVSTYQEYETKIRSVAGNHDGLIFGNIDDGRADGRGLDINKAEFIFAHFLADFQEGFGFGENEIAEKIKQIQLKVENSDGTGPLLDRFKKECREKIPFSKNEETLFGEHWWKKDIQDFCKLSVQVIDRVKKLNNSSPLNIPLAYRKAIDFPGKLSELPIKLGYYSWCEHYKDDDHGKCKGSASHESEVGGVRYIVLDTRNNFYENGTMDWIQLGWVYNELIAALKNKEGVIVFSHDPPDELPVPIWDRHEEYRTLIKMLRTFPNVIAVAYGHKHKNENRPPTQKKRFASFQTGSLADFPQVGREVKIYYKSCKDISAVDKDLFKEKNCNELKTKKGETGFQFRIESRFVRPRGNISESNGFKVEALLRASRRDSEKEEKTTFWRSVIPFFTKHTPLKAHEWPQKMKNSIVNNNDKPITMFPVIYFGNISDYPPQCFFKNTLFEWNFLEKIHNTRKALGLEGIKQFDKKPRPDLETVCTKLERTES